MTTKVSGKEFKAQLFEMSISFEFHMCCCYTPFSKEKQEKQYPFSMPAQYNRPDNIPFYL